MAGGGKLHLFVAIDRTTKFAFVQLHEKATTRIAGDFLRMLIEAVPYRIHTVLTDNGIQFTDPRSPGSAVFAIKQALAAGEIFRAHAFEYACAENDIEHRLTKPKHPWTNGQAARLEAVRAGPAADPTSDMGPMINIENVRRVEAMVAEAVAAGAKVVVRGGAYANGPLAKGAFHRPTLLEISDHSMRIAQDEVFGPVLAMQAFEDEDEAVALANDSIYGLAASVWSSDVDRPLRVARLIAAGTVWINNWAVVYSETEEGGYKQSGLGRLNGIASMEDFVEYKTIVHEVDVMPK